MELKEVFEPIVNFLKNFQKKDKEIESKNKAKERLQLVLMQDRASVSPDFFEMMKKEIIEVIKKYIEIDEEALEVELTRGLEGAEGMGPALIANIPIKNIKPVARKVEAKNGEEDPNVVAQQIIEEIKTVSEEKLSQDANAETIKEEKVEEVVTEAVTETAEKVADKVDEVATTTENVVEAATKEVTETIETVETAVTDEATQVAQEVTSTTEEIKDNKKDIKDTINNVKEGVSETISNVKNKAKESVKKIKTKAKAKN